MAGKVPYTRDCKRCGCQFITTDVRKIFCHKSCAQKYSAMSAHVRKRDRGPDYYEEYEWPRSLKRLYGITVEDYNTLFKLQSGLCAICDSPQEDQKRKLSVDHCHSTGRVRGLLCQKCNRALGLFNDNTRIMKRAMEYLT